MVYMSSWLNFQHDILGTGKNLIPVILIQARLNQKLDSQHAWALINGSTKTLISGGTLMSTYPGYYMLKLDYNAVKI